MKEAFIKTLGLALSMHLLAALEISFASEILVDKVVYNGGRLKDYSFTIFELDDRHIAVVSNNHTARACTVMSLSCHSPH